MTGPDLTDGLLERASRLRVDAAAAELFRAFDQAGIEARLLKGRAVAAWLYDEPSSRPYTDCDVLIGPGDFERAEEILESLSYARGFDDRGMPPWWREHAAEWVRDSDGLPVDLHRTLPGIGVDVAAAWTLLSADPDEVPVADYEAKTLSIPGRALHVALHAGQHGDDSGTPIADLALAVSTANPRVWGEAAELAAQLDATDALVRGLQLVPAGVELVERLTLPEVGSVEVELRAAPSAPTALGFDQLARATNATARAQILARKLVPPRAFMRRWDPSAGESRARLAWAYVRRPFWLLRHAPHGLRLWYRTRDRVQRRRRA